MNKINQAIAILSELDKLKLFGTGLSPVLTLRTHDGVNGVTDIILDDPHDKIVMEARKAVFAVADEYERNLKDSLLLVIQEITGRL